MTAAAWLMAGVALAVAVGMELRDRNEKRRRALKRRLSPLPPRENVIRLPPTGIGGIR